MNIYDFNRAGYDSLPDMENKDIIEKLQSLLSDYLEANQLTYLMLLNNDKHYYTVFNVRDRNFPEYLVEEMMEIIYHIFNNKIKSIEYSEENDAIEIWGVYQDDELPSMFLLFDYDWGVVTV